METEEQEIERVATLGELVWEIETNSGSLETAIRSPHSLQIDDNNKLYIGSNDGIYIMNLKKIANSKVFTEDSIDINDLLKKQFPKESLNTILLDFNAKAREGQERNCTTSKMMQYRLKLASLIESRVLLSSFKISPNGLLPNNEPVMALLLNTNMLILVGRIRKNFIEPYLPLSNCDLQKEATEEDLPIFFETSCFTWVDYYQDNEKKCVFFFVHYENTLEAWAFSYYSIGSSKELEFRRVSKEEYNESTGIMTGNVSAGAIELLVTDDKGKIHKLTYDVTWGEETLLKRRGEASFQTNFSELQFVSILPPHLTEDDNFVRFVYGAQSNCFVGGFDEEGTHDCVYSHKFPSNLSELLYHENGLELFFMDGTNVIYDIRKNDTNIHRKQGMYGIFGAAYSSTQVLKILVGPPHYFALKKTNVQIFSNVSENSPYFDIIYQMSSKIIQNLVKVETKNFHLYYSRKPLDFSDILMIFATNQINYRNFLKAYFATYDENLLESRSKKKTDLKDLLKGINSQIVEKFELTPEVKNHVERVILLNLMYFAPEFFRDSVNKLMNKTIVNFYTSIVLWYQEQNKLAEEGRIGLYIEKIKNYLKQERVSRNEMEIEGNNDTCPICNVSLNVKDSQCVNGHFVIRCHLSRNVIYFDDYFECKLCKQKYLKTCLEEFRRHDIDLNFSCTLCCNLLKKV